MAILSKQEKELLRQANRLLTNMQKVAKNDKNVENALKFAMSDINLAGGKNKYEVNIDTTERQKNAMLRSAQRVFESPYSRTKTREQLYRDRRKTFMKTFGIKSARKAKQLESLFYDVKNPKTGEYEETETSSAWKKIQDEPLYLGTSKAIASSIGEVMNDIGNKKFGLMMRFYTEAGLQSLYSQQQGFVSFLQDKDITGMFESLTYSELENIIDNKLWNNDAFMEGLGL